MVKTLETRRLITVNDYSVQPVYTSIQHGMVAKVQIRFKSAQYVTGLPILYCL